MTERSRAQGPINPVVDTHGHMGIGTTTPHGSAILDLTATNAGLLLPRLTQAERDAIPNPANGLIVFNITTGAIDYNFGSSGSPSWSPILSEATAKTTVWLLGGNTGTDPLYSFIGTTDAQPLVVRTNDVERMRIDQNGNVGIGTSSPDERLDVNGTIRFSGSLNPAGLSGNTGEVLVSNGPGAPPTWQIVSSNLAVATFGQITDGTNTGHDSLEVGNGSNLYPVGTGTVAANRFIATTGGGSTDAIDLGTSEVAGTLPVAHGGTGSSTALNNNRVMVSSGGAIVEGPALLDGQVLIGSTGSAPVAAGITGTANRVNVTTGAGSITISAPQDIATTSSPTFAAMTITGNASSGTVLPAAPGNTLVTKDFVATAGNSAVATNATLVGNGTTGTSLGINLAQSNSWTAAQTFPSSGAPGDAQGQALISSLNAASSGSIDAARIGSGISNTQLANSSVTINTGTGLSGGGNVALGGTLNLTNTGVTSLSGTTDQINVSAANGDITISTPQDIATTSSPTFAAMTLNSIASGSSASDLVVSNAGVLETRTIASLGLQTGSEPYITFAADAGLTDNRVLTAGTGIGLNNAGTDDGALTISNTGVTSLSGTTDQINVSAANGDITISTPQDIATTSSPTFAAMTLTAPLSETSGGTGENAYATGDILYASGTNMLDRRGIGSEGDLLTVSGGVPVWSSASDLVDTNAWGRGGTAATAGDVLGTTNTEDLNVVTNGSTRLTVDGTTGHIGIGAAPTSEELHVAGTIGATTQYDIRDGERVLSVPGDSNLFVGVSAGASNTTGYENTFVGFEAGTSTTTSFYSTAVGARALASLTGGTSGNTAFGTEALMSNTVGSGNTAVGHNALRSHVSGSSNVALGGSALSSDQTGFGNTAVGTNAMRDNIGGQYNTTVGFVALQANTSGSFNVALGWNAMFSNTAGRLNTAIGAGALYTSLGDSNVAVGTNAGQSITTGSGNTFLGYHADAAASNLTNATAIGLNAVVAADNSMVLGGTGPLSVNVGIGTTAPEQKFEVRNGNILLSSDTVAGQIRFAEPAGTNYSAFRADTQSTDITYTLPRDLGTGGDNYVLTDTAGDGNLAWRKIADLTTTNAWGRNGTAADPGNVLGTTNTENLNIVTNGSTRLTIDGTTGHIGIGATPTSEDLHVAGTIGATTQYDIRDGERVLSVQGDSNLFVGVNAGASNTTGTMNTFLGFEAGLSTTTSFYITAVGARALASLSPGTGYNTAVGTEALMSTTIGSTNVAVGRAALKLNTTGGGNTAVGDAALIANTTGGYNTAVGTSAMVSNTGGQYNTSMGFVSLHDNTSGSYNVAMGWNSLRFNTTGWQNTAIGTGALFVSRGDSNVAVGANAGDLITTGSGNTFLGYNADAATSTLRNATAIGLNALVAADNSMVLGATGAGAVNVGIGVSAPGARLDVIDSTPGATQVVHAKTFTTTAQAGLFEIANSTNSNNALEATTSGGGYAGKFTATGGVAGNGIYAQSDPGGIGLNVNAGRVFLSYGTVSNGGTVPNDVAIVRIDDDGNGLTSPLITLPTAGVSNGQVLILFCDDPQGATVGTVIAGTANFAARGMKTLIYVTSTGLGGGWIVQ